MTAESQTLIDLVSRFQLRRRASTPVFAAGVRLANRGHVALRNVTRWTADAHVSDRELFVVRLEVAAGGVVGQCSCSQSAAHDICRHQVAAAHALWVSSHRDRVGRDRVTGIPRQGPAERPSTTG